MKSLENKNGGLLLRVPTSDTKLYPVSNKMTLALYLISTKIVNYFCPKRKKEIYDFDLSTGGVGITFGGMGTNWGFSTKVVNIFHNIFPTIFRQCNGVFPVKKYAFCGRKLTFPLVNITYLWYNN